MKRYAPEFDGNGNPSMTEDPKGVWVKFEDVPQWQPIETAPKDGTRIHAWNGDYQTTIYWYRAPKPPYQPGWAQVQGLRDEFYDDGMWNPTHWMPLPAPPK